MLRKSWVFLMGTKDHKLTYGLDIYFSADWVSDLDWKCITGFIITIAGGKVAWVQRNKPQSWVKVKWKELLKWLPSLILEQEENSFQLFIKSLTLTWFLYNKSYLDLENLSYGSLCQTMCFTIHHNVMSVTWNFLMTFISAVDLTFYIVKLWWATGNPMWLLLNSLSYQHNGNIYYLLSVKLLMHIWYCDFSFSTYHLWIILWNISLMCYICICFCVATT